jgi:hypothetical protein
MKMSEVYQIKKLKDGIELDLDNDFRTSIYKYPIIKKIDVIPNHANYCVILKAGNDVSKVKVIYGKDKGLEYSIDNSFLKKPNLLPCFRRDNKKWFDCVDQIKKGFLPSEIENIIDNAMSMKQKNKITASLGSDSLKDSILSIKVIQEILEPYLGPVGLCLSLKAIKERVFDT